MKPIIFVLTAITLLISCNREPLPANTQSNMLNSAKSENTKTIYIADYMVDCEGVAPQKCYLVKENVADDWMYWYDEIEGFDYEAGYEYELQVNEVSASSQPADVSMN